MADAVNPSMNGDQRALCDPAPQFAISDAGAEKLSASHHSVRTGAQLGKFSLDRAAPSTHTVL
jgi:hypothetical protein